MASDKSKSIFGRKEIDRLMKFVILPLVFLVTILMILIEQWRLGGLVALVLLVFGYLVYVTPRFQKDVIGIPDNPFQGFGLAFGLFATFFIMMRIIPAFSIVVPTVPQAVTSFSFGTLALGTPVSLAILVVVFPFAETFWKSSLLSLLKNLYNATSTQAIIFTGLIFGFVLHLLAYGVVLASAETFGVALQQINNITGLLFTASSFGMFASWVLLKTRNFLPVALAHSGINAAVVTTTFAIIQFL